MSDMDNVLHTNRNIPDVPAEDEAPTGYQVDLDKKPDADTIIGQRQLLDQMAEDPRNGDFVARMEEAFPGYADRLKAAEAAQGPEPSEAVIKETAPEKPVVKPGMPIKAAPLEDAEKLPDSAPRRGGIMTAEEATNMGINTQGGEVVDPSRAFEEEAEKADKLRRQNEDEGYKALAEEVLKEEQARYDRFEATLALPDDDPRKKELIGDRSAKVETTTISAKEREKEDKQMGITGYDEDELLPAYTMEDTKEDATPSADEPEPPTPADEDDYAEYIRGLEVGKIVPSQHPTVYELREPMIETVIETPKKAGQNLGDQAFMNAITRFKQDRYGKYTIPMINSGFMADIVGTGVVDLQQLYINVSEDTRIYEYQMEQMRVIIRNITGTTPKIDPIELRNKIHFQDFQMMAYGHLCATLKTVESVANCSKCGQPFRITTRPKELLINDEEIEKRAMEISQAPNVESYSLMTKYKIVTTRGGIVVTLGHPSYANELTILNSFLAYYNEMTPADKRRFESHLNTLYYIRKIQLPNGTPTANIYQNYLALGLMDTPDLKAVQKAVAEMRDEIIVPKFGIREVVCPHCGEVNKNITYRNILDLLFLHFQLESYLHPDDTTAST